MFNSKRSFRCGMTIVEMIVALGVLAVLLMLVGQWVVFALIQQRLGDQQRRAMETAANLLERSTTQTWETLSTEQLQPLAEAAKEELGSELWKVSLEVQDVPPEKLDPPQLQSRTIRAVVEHSTNRLLRAELTTIRHHITGAKP